MARINHRMARNAIEHRFLHSLSGGLIITAWTAFLFRSFIVGVLLGLGTSLLLLVLWMPKYGPMRNYVERHWDD
jgi:hypothetical protein